ncbi:MAG: hypothetical protein AAF591_05750 [Verrucomicrobiota bacterium]
MIKRLLSFWRRMNEPTFQDEKAELWAGLFQKRARFTGQLPEPELLEQIGIPADDPFWKQDNANPSAGFAVNFKIPVREALKADSPGSLAAEALDDFGQSVAALPLKATAPNYYFHVFNGTFTLDSAPKTLEPTEMAWIASRGFVEALSELEKTVDLEDTEDIEDDIEDDDEPINFDPAAHTITRITWDPDREAWYVITTQNGDNKRLDTNA